MKKYILFLKEHIFAPLAVSLWLAVVVGCVVFFSELEIDPLMDTSLNQADLCLFGSVLFSGFTLFYFLVQAFLAVFYRPYPELAEKDLPFVTVIIPAYNEGMQIASTVESVMKADYPAGKFEVIVINDGSEDDTWAWIEKASSRYPGQVVAINHTQNRGKKHALCTGIERAKGEVVVIEESFGVRVTEIIK
jgi:hyaluronan synthase